MILDTEAAVIANFEFLGHTDMDMEEEEGDVEDEIYNTNADTKPNKVNCLLLQLVLSYHFTLFCIETNQCY